MSENKVNLGVVPVVDVIPNNIDGRAEASVCPFMAPALMPERPPLPTMAPRAILRHFTPCVRMACALWVGDDKAGLCGMRTKGGE